MLSGGECACGLRVPVEARVGGWVGVLQGCVKARQMSCVGADEAKGKGRLKPPHGGVVAWPGVYTVLGREAWRGTCVREEVSAEKAHEHETGLRGWESMPVPWND